MELGPVTAELESICLAWVSAQFCVLNKLKSPIGKPQETLGHVDVACRQVIFSGFWNPFPFLFIYNLLNLLIVNCSDILRYLIHSEKRPNYCVLIKEG